MPKTKVMARTPPRDSAGEGTCTAPAGPPQLLEDGRARHCCLPPGGAASCCTCQLAETKLASPTQVGQTPSRALPSWPHAQKHDCTRRVPTAHSFTEKRM